MNSLWDGFNKRKFARLHLTCEVKIQPVGKQKTFTASTEDVGMGGVSVMLPEALERFDRCKIGLELKDGEPPVQCTGRCVWVIPSQDRKSSKKNFDTGLEFLDMDEFSRKRLQSFLTPLSQKT
ncbi:MAG TPA: PilZ domain-containing protein [Candidatus Omnitrophota bacterium]|nr:PilZ domain-containing protein [Candidatus Omnitrophota bacterium]HRY85281.1 PilZ domain-containing protein [Candidatus Omnitrophota bacterium]